ncbi:MULTISPECIES: CHASE4 domain-containing protein [Aeromonas]|uniref:GAF domain-containing protein n=1 Tax=Aeromonas schubertii TaxID=652 RepID=A0ABS7VDU3_9GAMM|nr:CHASE4 domain-containing protein [Aeromonas schubertii]MBZ6067237.1 GAF domain-containing protein [Aeromonas schubertii]MBZ6071247.1 GAF domain-containing protein [Aeromonas schubertii]QCG47569.1 GAF domain-containing protein [Aeromonas schubertii]
MKISRRITLSILLVLLLLLTSGYLGLHLLVEERFAELERGAIDRNQNRVVQAIGGEVGNLLRLTRDWAEWDDTYHYMADRDPRYLASNINARTFETLGFDHIAIYDGARHLLFAQGYEQGRVGPLSAEQLARQERLLARQPVGREFSGLWLDGEERLLIAGAPILTSEGEGPSRGILLLARHLDDPLLVQLRKRLSLTLALPDEQALASALNEEQRRNLMLGERALKVAGQEITVFGALEGLEGQMIPFSVTQGRMWREEGRAIANRLILWGGGAVLLFGALVLLILNQGVTARLERLAANLRLITNEGTVRRVLVEGRDELAQVALDCNQMLDTLETLREEQLMAQRRLRGQLDALLALASSDALTREDARRAAGVVTRAICEGTGAVRASLWFCTEGEERLYCQDLYLASKQEHQQGFSMPMAMLQGRYEQSRQGDEPCLVLSDPYDLARFSAMLTQLGLTPFAGRVLMAPLHHEGELLGFIIAEHERPQQAWQADELTFVLCVCDFSTQTLLTLSKLIRLNGH